jgi:hypothetical protein
MAFDFKVIIAAGVLMAAHALCFILWISGWFVLRSRDFRCNFYTKTNATRINFEHLWADSKPQINA